MEITVVTVPEKITQQMINGRELDIIGTRMSLNQWIPTAKRMADGTVTHVLVANPDAGFVPKLAK